MRRAALIASMFSVATVAQVPREAEFGTRIPVPKPAKLGEGGKGSEDDRARAALIAFGVCTVARHPTEAELLTRLPADDPKVPALLSRMATLDCLQSGIMRFSARLMRGAVFVGLYRLRFAKAAQPIPPEAATDFAVEVDDPSSDAGRLHLTLREFGDCVARAVPAPSRALVLAEPAGRAEAAAFSALVPQLGPCLVEGSKVTFSKLVLTGIIGESLFRLASASTQARSAG